MVARVIGKKKKKNDVRAVVSGKDVFTKSTMDFQGGTEKDLSSHMSGLTGAVLHIYLTKKIPENLSGPLKSQILILCFVSF